MSTYKKGKEQKPKIESLNTLDPGTLNPGLFKEVEVLIQALKNNQRCYAEAASLVNSSQLRNFFEKIELERTIFMEKIARFIERIDLISGKSGHDADVIWFASVEVSNVSKNDFDLSIVQRCLQCEDVLQQNYDTIVELRGNERIFRFLDEQRIRLESTEEQLKAFQIQFKS